MGSNLWVLAVSWVILTSATLALWAVMLWWKSRKEERMQRALREDPEAQEAQGLLRRATSWTEEKAKEVRGKKAVSVAREFARGVVRGFAKRGTKAF